MIVEPSFERFTHSEAQAKVGKRVQTTATFVNVAKGTMGRVVRIKVVDHDPDNGHAMYDIGVRWDMVGPSQMADVVVPADEPYETVRRNTPTLDWFNKGEYERYLVEVDNQ